MSLHLSENKVVVNWEENKTKTYFYVWLKDNSPENRHENGQKLTESREVDINIQPKSVTLNENILVVEWKDGKTSKYSETYLNQLTAKTETNPILWNQLENHSVFDYEEVLENPSKLLECLKNIQIYGFTHLKNVPNISAKIVDVVALFGYVKETNYGKFYDVIAKKNPENLADTQLGLPPHTDNPYRNPTPTVQLLHCLKSGVTGGKTILVDGFNIAQKLKEENPSYFKLLSEQKMFFKFKSNEHWLENEAPIISEKNGIINAIKFNNRSIQPFNIDDEIMIDFYKAYQYFENQLQNEENHLQFKLEPSEVIIYDNERILHGRTAYNLVSERHLQGCYADRDALYSKIRTLENNN